MSFEIKRLISEEKHKQQNRIVIGLKSIYRGLSKQHIIQNKVTIKSNQTTYACLADDIWYEEERKVKTIETVPCRKTKTKHWAVC